MKKFITLLGVLVLMAVGFSTVASAEVSTQSTDIDFEGAYTIEAGESITSTINNEYGDPLVYKVKFPYSTDAGFAIGSLDAYYNMEIYDENYRQVAFVESDDDIIMPVDGNSWYYLVVRAGTTSSYGWDFDLRTIY